MGAALITSGGKDIFQNGTGGGSGLVSISGIDSMVQGITIYDSVSVQMGETMQFFLTFDDATKFIHFGQAIGSVQVQGTAYCSSRGDMPGAGKFGGVYKGLVGKATKISVGGATVRAVITSAQLSIVSEMDIMGHFTFTFAVIHNG